MKAITFKQFMLTYNFRQYNNDCLCEKDRYNTSIIRINYKNENTVFDYDWFEFGIYDFGGDCKKLEQIKHIFGANILNAYVSSFGYNEDLEVFEIYLSDDKEIDEVNE